MQREILLVTGSSGLIGSEVATHFDALGWTVHGIDNNQRAAFFGPGGDTRSAAIPLDDFDTNAVGTLKLLEAARRSCPESPFVQMSTNKVYGDAPNELPLVELANRWDYADAAHAHGIPESFRIDAPRPAAVYNMGGGKANSCSVLEAFAMAAERSGRPMEWTYDEKAREGDHICYYSDLRRIEADYPGWRPEISLAETFDQIVESWERRQASQPAGSGGGMS